MRRAEPVRKSKTTEYWSSNELDYGSLYLGIDASLTGFAACLMDDSGEYFIRVFTPGTRGAARLAELKSLLHAFVGAETLKDVALESAVNHSSSASVLGEVSGVVKEYLFSEHNITPLMIPPTSLKKFVCGKGTATKDVVMMKVLQRYGEEIPDNNAADAYVLARMVRGETISSFEADAILKLSEPKYRA